MPINNSQRPREEFSHKVDNSKLQKSVEQAVNNKRGIYHGAGANKCANIPISGAHRINGKMPSKLKKAAINGVSSPKTQKIERKISENPAPKNMPTMEIKSPAAANAASKITAPKSNLRTVNHANVKIIGKKATTRDTLSNYANRFRNRNLKLKRMKLSGRVNKDLIMPQKKSIWDYEVTSKGTDKIIKGIPLNLAKKAASGVKDLAKAGINKGIDAALSGDSSGAQTVQFTRQAYTYGKQAVQTIGRTIKNSAKRFRKTEKQVTEVIDKLGKFRKKRKLTKSAKLQTRVNKTVRNVTKRTLKTSVKATKVAAKATAKAVKLAARAAKITAKAAAKAAQIAAKAVVSATAKIASIIAATFPWSLIILAVLLIILIVALVISSVFSGAGIMLQGGTAWLLDDSETSTADDIYDKYNEYIDKIDNIVDNSVIEAMKDSVTAFCADNSEPKNIISYMDKKHTVTAYPAYKKDTTINKYIDEFELSKEDYVDLLSTLFVLMTREKQQEDGVDENQIYEFVFEDADLQEFIGGLNDNSSRWGDTFIIKTEQTVTGATCPGANCKKKKKAGCKCRRSYNHRTGKTRYYCGGHPYCPNNHTKNTYKLYLVTDYYDKSIEEIYNFSDIEKQKFELSKQIVGALVDYYEEGS